MPLAILLTRVVPRAVSTTVYREQAQLDGFLCLQAVVGRLERFAQAFGDPVKDASQTAWRGDYRAIVPKLYTYFGI